MRTDSPKPRADGNSFADSVNILPDEPNKLILSIDIAWNAVCSSSPSLNFKSSAFKSKCPLAARIQPIVDKMMVNGSFSINSSALTTISSVCSAQVVRRRPSFVFLSYVFLMSLNHAFNWSFWASSLASKRCNCSCSARRAASSRLISISSSLRRERRRVFNIAST